MLLFIINLHIQKQKERGRNRQKGRKAHRQTDRQRTQKERQSIRETHERYLKSETLKMLSENTKSLSRQNSLSRASPLFLKSNLHICIFEIKSVFPKYFKK